MPSDPTQRDARDAELTARRDAEGRALTAAINAVTNYGNARSGLLPSHREREEASGDVMHELIAYRDAVAARVRAELLQSGTPVWVATDSDDIQSRVYDHAPARIELPNGAVIWRDMQDGMSDGLPLIDQLVVPPGTCVEGRVVLVPGGGNG